MASKKIARKSSRERAAAARRQGALPCLIIAGLVFLVFAFFFFASLRTL